MPSAFVRARALPLTPNGKVDRQALPAPGSTRQARASVRGAAHAGRRSCSRPSGPRCLRVERVGVHDNFFELGGHSLLATQVVSRVRAAFQVELPLRALFEAPTVAGLAQTIEQAGPRAARLPARRSAPVPRGSERCRCRSRSSGSGSSTSSSPDSAAYNMPAAVRAQRAARRGRAGAQPRTRSCGATRRCAPRSPRADGRPRAASSRRGAPWQLPVVDLGALAGSAARGGGPAAGPRGGARGPSTSASGPLLRVAPAPAGGAGARAAC